MTTRLATARRELAFAVRSETAPFPAHCTVEVNYDCQARCESCMLWTKDFKRHRIGDRKVLSTPETLDLIADLAANGCASVFFCGGEPFIRKDLLSFVEAAARAGMSAYTISNGGLIRNPAIAERIVRSGMTSLGFSLDGPTAGINDRIRGLDGYFDDALEAIRLVEGKKRELGSRTPTLTIQCTVSSRNVELLPDMVSLARRAGVPEIAFHYLSVVADEVVESTNRRMGARIAGTHNYSGIPRSLLLSPAQLAGLDAILEAVRARAGVESVRVDMDVGFGGDRSGLAEGRFPVKRCRAAWESAVISPTGDMHVCSMFTEHSLGNVRDEGVAGIWNGELARSMRGELGRGLPDICQQCCQQHADADSTWDRVRGQARRLGRALTG